MVVILLVIAIFQFTLLIDQFTPVFLNVEVSLSSYFSYVAFVTASIGVAALIWIEKENLEEFHVDKFALLTFILGSLLRPRIGILGEECFAGLAILSGISMAIVWIVRKPRIPKTNRHWAFLGIIAGGIFAILIVAFGLSLQLKGHASPLLQNGLFSTVLGQMLRQFSDGIAFEEILFRGFVWGYLRRFGLAENKTIWIQGLLFWLVHFGSAFIRPFTFFLAIPLGTLVQTKLTSYSKQIFPSILAHAMINILGGLFNFAIY